MPSRSRHHVHTYSQPPKLPPLIHLWILRILMPLGGHPDFIGQRGCPDDMLAEVVGLGHLDDPHAIEFKPTVIGFPQ